MPFTLYKEQHAKRTTKKVQHVHLCSNMSQADLILYEAILYSNILLSFILSVVFSLFLAKSKMRAFRLLSCLIERNLKMEQGAELTPLMDTSFILKDRLLS